MLARTTAIVGTLSALVLTGAAGATAGARTAAPAASAASTPTRIASTPGSIQAFVSAPRLHPPIITITRRAAHTASGYLFLAPAFFSQNGPLIVDNGGQLIWSEPLPHGVGAFDFRVQRYRGKPVLTWFQGTVATSGPMRGIGIGSFVIADSSYHVIARVRAGHGYQADLHDFVLTPRGTALLFAYKAVPADLTSVGGPHNGTVWDSVLQEIDVRTGRVVFEWHSIGHVAFSDSYAPVTPAGVPWDYFHINSLDIGRDGNLIVSARQTWAVYKIDRHSGAIIWRLGGKQSSFVMGPGTQFAWQHDARLLPDGSISVFDDGATPPIHKQSRGIVLALDMTHMTATLARVYTHTPALLANSQGNMQLLPNGDVLISWGDQPYISEYDRNGSLRFDAHLPFSTETYRAFRFRWVGHPRTRPAIAARRARGAAIAIYASWNGATEVASWRVLAASGASALRPLRTVRRNGFETLIHVTASGTLYAVQALSASGQVLGTSAAVPARG